MSFNPEKLTVKAGQAIRHAQEMVETRQHRFIRPLHLLKALLDETDGIMKPLLQRIGVNIGQLNNMVDGELDRLPSSTSDEPIGAGPEAVKVLNAAAKQASEMGDEFTSTEHLLLALTKVEDQSKRLLALNAVNEHAFEVYSGGKMISSEEETLVRRILLGKQQHPSNDHQRNKYAQDILAVVAHRWCSQLIVQWSEVFAIEDAIVDTGLLPESVAHLVLAYRKTSQ